MSKHSPGPWEVQNMTVFNKGCMFVANCDGLGDVERMETSRANAKLIAAAPDLLAALQAYQAAGFGNSTDFTLQGIAYDKAVAAIAKVGG